MRDELMHLLDEYHKARAKLAFVHDRRAAAEKEVARYRSDAIELEGRIHDLTERIESLNKQDHI